MLSAWIWLPGLVALAAYICYLLACDDRLRRFMWNVFNLFGYRSLEAKIDLLIAKMENFMATLSQDLKDFAQQIDAATSKVADRLTALQGSIKNSMTDQEVAEIKGALQNDIDHLKAMGADPVNPVPPAPVTPSTITKKGK